MLMHLSTNTRLDIVFVVHQCILAVNIILRYLVGTIDKKLTIKPTEKLEINFYVNANFAGLWGAVQEQNPIALNSRTGFVIAFMGYLLLWTSRLQTMIALSAMGVEYIALLISIRKLIATRRMLQEIESITLKINTDPTLATHSTVFRLPQSLVYEDNRSFQKFAMVPKSSPRTKHIIFR